MQYTEANVKAFPNDSGNSTALLAGRRVTMTAGYLAYAGSTTIELGTLEVGTQATDTSGAVRLRTAPGTAPMIASEAITQYNPVYAAANGKVAASGTIQVGYALTAATADLDEIEVLRTKEDSDAAAAGGTTAAAFLVDSDSATPKIELAAQTGGTGNYKGTVKPPATLTGNRVYTLAGDADATIVNEATAQSLTNKTLGDGTKDTRAAVTINPAADSGAGSTITAGVVQVNVGAVVNDANDWIVLPAIAGVGIGHTIRIACNAGTNFEMRTPASSNTTINGQDSDGTKEYLCTDTDLVIVTKATATGWVAQSITALGAVRTAVVPD